MHEALVIIGQVSSHSLYRYLKLSINSKYIFYAFTVNMVIFAGDNFAKKVRKTFHGGVIFTILLLFP